MALLDLCSLVYAHLSLLLFKLASSKMCFER